MKDKILKILNDNKASCSGITDVIYEEDFDIVVDQLNALFSLPIVVSTSCDLSNEQLKRKIQIADMEHRIKRERT